MNTHPFRWRGLVFGLPFLAAAGSWAVWQQDLLSQRQFSLALSGVLIVLGTLGVVATFWRPGPRQTAPRTPTQTDPLDTPEDIDHEQDPDPQP